MKCLYILFFILSLIGCGSTRSFVEVPVNEPYDVIIVPGYPHYGEKWEDVMKIRVCWSKYLYDNGYTKNIIYSGSAVYSKYIESITMAMYAKEMRIDTANIFIETEAEHSTENVYFSYLIAKRHDFKRIAIASDPFQSRHLVTFIKKYNLPIDFVPIDFDTMRVIEKSEPIISLVDAIDEDFIAIKEKEGFFKRVKGTLGLHIIWDEKDLTKKRQIKRLKRRGRCISK
jgi:hypothetical protein